ncbi:MAG: hypothetical protein MZV64_35130 [Ignavibacteriales bacterium]|nr:hypothetical protein [Ignavibacteriales bacterium]
MPYLQFEAPTPNKPVIAIEIKSRKPEDWSPLLAEVWGEAMADPAQWAKKAEEAGADILVLALTVEDSPEDAVKAVKSVLGATSLPLIVWGPGQAEKDNELMVASLRSDEGRKTCARHLRGQELPHDRRHRHGERTSRAVRARRWMSTSPKQLNILISDMGMPLRPHPDGPDHRRARLRHRVWLLGDGTPAPGRPAGRRDDAAPDDRHARLRSLEDEGSPRSAKACPKPGAIGRTAPSIGRPLPPCRCVESGADIVVLASS